MQLTYDFKLREQEGAYPSHGWAENSQGAKLLWFPLKHTLHNADEVRRRLGGTKRKIRDCGKFSPIHETDPVAKITGIDSAVNIIGGRVSTIPFHTTWRELVWILAQLHGLISKNLPTSLEEISDEEEVSDLDLQAPILIKSAFIWLRGLLDLFAFHVPAILFEKYEQCPKSFRDLRKAIAEGSVARWNPLVDLNRLQTAFSITDWFDALRDPDGGDKGIRDSIVHASTRVVVGYQTPGGVTAYLTGDKKRRELISVLRIMLTGYCTLCAEIQGLIDRRERYEVADAMRFYGDTEHTCGFWPRIEEAQSKANGIP